MSHAANHSFFSLNLVEKLRVMYWNKSMLLYFLKELSKSSVHQYYNRKKSIGRSFA